MYNNNTLFSFLIVIKVVQKSLKLYFINFVNKKKVN